MVLHILSYNDETYRTWSGTILDYIFQGLIDVLNHFFRAVFVRMSKKKFWKKMALLFTVQQTLVIICVFIRSTDRLVVPRTGTLRGWRRRGYGEEISRDGGHGYNVNTDIS